MADAGQTNRHLPQTRFATLAQALAGLRIYTVLTSVTAGLIAFVVYLKTLAPSFTWDHHGADGGDFLAAAATLGIPHPPGYPLYTLLLHGWLGIIPWGNLAYRGNLFSAVCAALTVALLVSMIILAIRQHNEAISPLVYLPTALATGLIFAFGQPFWAQALITEVYVLNALLTVCILWLLLRWRIRTQPQDAYLLVLIGFTFGLGLGNHLTLALLIPPSVWWLWIQRAAVKERRQWLFGVGAFALGLCIYLYLPLRAGTAPVDWGTPRTPSALWWMITGDLYRHLVFGIEATQWWGRFGAWAAQLRLQFGIAGMAIAILGLWRIDLIDSRLRWLTLSIFLVYSVYAAGYDTVDSYLYLIPAHIVASIWLAYGLATLLQWLQSWRHRLLLPAAALVVLLPIWPLVANYEEVDQSGTPAATEFGEAVMSAAEPDALLLVARDAATFTLWYYLYAEQRRPDLAVANINLLRLEFDWYWEILKRTHPQIMPEDGQRLSFEEFIVYNVAHRPVYLAEELPELDLPYARVPQGPLWKLVSE